MTWLKGVCTGMTARQVRGLQQNATVVTIRLKGGEQLTAVRVEPGKSEDYAMWSRVGAAGDFAVDDVETWVIF